MSALIVGDHDDTHVAAVVKATEELGAARPLVIDAPLLQNRGFSLALDRLVCEGSTLPLDDHGTGWLRRYAPSGWGTGTVSGSLEAVSKRAFLALVGSITRLGCREWLTPLDELLNAEDRLVQLKAARNLGLRIPRTIVTSDADEAVARLGERFVVKPLAGGYFWADDGPRAVFSTELSAAKARKLDFAAAPFVAQERVHVVEHLRVVTVGSLAQVAVLDAPGRPLDWRQEDAAHFAWRPTVANDACELALRLAAHLAVGYSSQDWVRDDQGLVFLDLNPGGQWLFLPSKVADPVTRAIASFLCGVRA